MDAPPERGCAQSRNVTYCAVGKERLTYVKLAVFSLVLPRITAC